LQMGKYVMTSMGLTIVKNRANSTFKISAWLPGFFGKRTSAA